MKINVAVFAVKEKESANAPDYDIVWNNGQRQSGKGKPSDNPDDIPF